MLLGQSLVETSTNFQVSRFNRDMHYAHATSILVRSLKTMVLSLKGLVGKIINQLSETSEEPFHMLP